MNSDKILSISAMIISLSTLFIILYQTNIMRTQQYSSVLPYLEIWNSNPSLNSYKLILQNNGLGPAFIEDIHITYKDSIIHGDFADFYKRIILQSDTINFLHSSINKNMLIPAGNSIEMVQILDSKEDVKKIQKWLKGDIINIQIRYRSIYDEFWQISSIDGVPVKEY